MHGGSNVAVDQAQAVRTVDGLRLVREPEVEHRAVEPVAGPVAGEDASGTIASMGSRGQADNEESSAGFTKAGHGTSPVIPISKSPDLVVRDLFTILHQSRTAAAIQDVSLGGPLCHLG